MEIIELREAIEFFLMRLDVALAQDRGMAMSVLTGEGMGKISEEVMDRLCDEKLAGCTPDFNDDEGRPRLRVKTIMALTGLNPNVIVSLPQQGLHENFVDALDFISLNKNKLRQDKVPNKQDFYAAHKAVVDYGPPEVVEMFMQKFRESFGPIPYDYIDEDGNELITPERLAEFFGITVDEVNEEFEEMEKLGHTKTVTLLPDPDDGAIH